MFYQADYKSPLGSITLASDGSNLVGLWFQGQKYYAKTVLQPMASQESLPVFQTVKQWLDRYFTGQNPATTGLPLKPAGSEFRQEVWRMLYEIPYGQVVTYGLLAQRLALKRGLTSMSAQAVGGAVGHNPISILIPCHRVVGANGSLTGYAGGISRKIKLLELEGADTSRLVVPKNGSAVSP